MQESVLAAQRQQRIQVARRIGRRAFERRERVRKDLKLPFARLEPHGLRQPCAQAADHEQNRRRCFQGDHLPEEFLRRQPGSACR